MPSYRVVLTIGALRGGIEPASVLPTARDAAAELANVESWDIGIVSGMPRITVRFTADTPGQARNVGRHVTSTVAEIAEPLAVKVTERVKGRWYVVR